MLPQTQKLLFQIKFKRLLSFIFLVGLVADLLPHPALGPSFLVTAYKVITYPQKNSHQTQSFHL